MVSSLGFWQLERMQWKKNLIELRKDRLTGPIVRGIDASPFPWSPKAGGRVRDYVYRVVEVRGYFDHKQTQFVGPRPVTAPQTGSGRSGRSDRSSSGGGGCGC